MSPVILRTVVRRRLPPRFESVYTGRFLDLERETCHLGGEVGVGEGAWALSDSVRASAVARSAARWVCFCVVEGWVEVVFGRLGGGGFLDGGGGV